MMDIEIDHFHARRSKVMDAIGQDGVAVFVSSPERMRSKDTNYPYRPDSDLLYLTGFEEPGALLVLIPGHPEGPVHMFVRPRDPDREQWDGLRLGPEGVVRELGVDKAYSIDEVDGLLPGLIERATSLHYALGEVPEFDRKILDWIRSRRYRRNKPPGFPSALVDVRAVTHEMRLIKEAEELALMRRAAEITCEAHTAAMRESRPGMAEYELQAIIEHTFKRLGAGSWAYASIVGTGRNATILHYHENNVTTRDGDIVLIDAGAEYQYYAADITRSFPVSGKFTPAQRDLYEAVLDAEKQCIQDIAPGLPFCELQDRTARRLSDALIQLGLLSGSVDEVLESETYKKYFPHSVSHWLGIDVHDVGLYMRTEDVWRKIEPNMVLTVEPGLYVPSDDEDAPEEMRGVGIRIEDDIVVTDGGYENLTAACPKEASVLEGIIGSSYR
jgi:Xaa-Pro aminopeptidase